MDLNPKAQRRQILNHCLAMAKQDEAYAKFAAQDYERRWPELFTGLAERFASDLARAKKDIREGKPQ